MIKKLLSRTSVNKEEEEEVLLLLPYDVIFEIFTRLPTMSLLRFRWACKYCFNLIQDPNFVKIHLSSVSSSTNNNPLVVISSRPVDAAAAAVDQLRNLHFLSYSSSTTTTTNMLGDGDDDVQLVSLLDVKVPYSSNPWTTSFTILGSCNGLLCVRCYSVSLRREKIFVWNPCTNEYKTVSDASIEMIRRECTTADNILGTFVYGFGYDRSIDDYKVIRNTCFYNSDDGGVTLVDVYTLGVRGGGSGTSTNNNSWRKVLHGGSSSLGNRFHLWDSNGNEGLFINGHIYWMARSTCSAPWNMIVSFDIVKEEYKEITKLPRRRRINPDKAASLKLLRNVNGCLCLSVIYIYFTHDQQSVDIWVMKKNKHNANIVGGGGGEDHISWDKLHTVSAPGLLTFKPFKFCKNGKIVMVMNENDEVILFNSSNPTQSKQIIRFVPDEMSLTGIEPYVDCLSLVSLNSGTYNSMGRQDYHHHHRQPNKHTSRVSRFLHCFFPFI